MGWHGIQDGLMRGSEVWFNGKGPASAPGVSQCEFQEDFIRYGSNDPTRQVASGGEE